MKPKTKRILKISSLSILTTVFVGLIVGVSTSWDNTKIINGGGSTAVLPLINDLSNNYNGDGDVVASAGGSGVGISSILTNSKEFGMASKNPNLYKENIDRKDKNYLKWEKIRAKTITIAWDGIAIVYKSNDKQNVIDINENTLGKIYAAFAGTNKFTFNDLNKNNSDCSELIPFARNGGAITSGTADAFLKDSNINNINWEGLDKIKIEEILNAGSYSNFVNQTAEANAQTWDRVKDSKSGTLTYLSTGFVLNNYKEIEDYGFQIMTYKGKKLFDKDITSHNITKGYDWFRPLNLMVSLNVVNERQYIKNFINWIFDKKDGKAKEIINNSGYVYLSDEQIKSMSKNNYDNKDPFWNSSDYDLKYCGAKP